VPVAGGAERRGKRFNERSLGLRNRIHYPSDVIASWQSGVCVPVLRSLADGGFRGPALGDLGYRGERLVKTGETLGINVALRLHAVATDSSSPPASAGWLNGRSLGSAATGG
jgi:hypothetical protein